MLEHSHVEILGFIVADGAQLCVHTCDKYQLLRVCVCTGISYAQMWNSFYAV